MSHPTLAIDPAVTTGVAAADPALDACVAGIRGALVRYPHFCVASIPGPPDDKGTLITLAAAVAGTLDPNESDAEARKRLSFTNVRIDRKNAEAKRRTGTRYSRTNQPMACHTDSSFKKRPHELVAFQCVTHDEIGGESILAAVEDVVAQLDEETITLLKDPVYPYGKALRPILTGEPGQMEIRHYRAQMNRPLEEGHASLDERYLAAVDRLDAALGHRERYHRFKLHAGEILFMQNNRVMHGREGFGGDSNRHFYRIRLHTEALNGW